ncbi:MAG: aldo/keto reductase [SAR86 cluster bacterium]|uniref:Aldo/keto reductase n=1 Tax=SAR86 cluster bacterium TaxID=2030880 RepID=A0A2A5CD28_9GAMM|nr:aldo/keto reductase [Gammaproteobacteria bacterium AH-315-E17]PCJ41784.1 MAG: aldo/keto reductase [SAR86 cluster bacterium]
MHKRLIGSIEVTAIGFGCMSISHAYGPGLEKAEAQKVLHRALDIGHTFLDTAALYGFGANEELLGEALSGRRNEYTLASKCGLFKNSEGKREINGRPEVIKQTCEDSLRRLKTDYIDLYYLHRLDKKVPIEESVGALAELVKAGKIGHIGLSEVSAETLRKAHAVHPISALQNEYSLLTRNPEIASLEACKELGVALVAFSPVSRGLLTDEPVLPGEFPQGDIRPNMPRFQGDAYEHNLSLLDHYSVIAEKAGCSRAQLALAWLLAQGDHVIPIPGTTSIAHMEENFAAGDLKLNAGLIDELDQHINQNTIRGERYNAATTAEIDTENFS